MPETWRQKRARLLREMATMARLTADDLEVAADSNDTDSEVARVITTAMESWNAAIDQIAGEFGAHVD